MLLRILASTDGRFIGTIVDSTEATIVLSSAFEFSPTSRKHVSGSLYRLSNYNYSIIAEEVISNE